MVDKEGICTDCGHTLKSHNRPSGGCKHCQCQIFKSAFLKEVEKLLCMHLTDDQFCRLSELFFNHYSTEPE